jgi:chromate transporter
MTATLIHLFITFFVIGIFTFGGGYAMLSLIQAQVVVVHAWIDESTFANIVAISQMTPGPIGINCATYVGYEVLEKAGAGHLLCIFGSFTATLAVVIPSFLIVLTIVKFYTKFNHNYLFEGVMNWLRPAVIGLIGAAAIILILDSSWSGIPLFSEYHVKVITDNFPDWKSWALFAAAFASSLWLKANPILVILLGGLAGILLY